MPWSDQFGMARYAPHFTIKVRADSWSCAYDTLHYNVLHQTTYASWNQTILGEHHNW